MNACVLRRFVSLPKPATNRDELRHGMRDEPSRFAKHFDKDNNPSKTLIKAKQERLDNWHTLQELAGII